MVQALQAATRAFLVVVACLILPACEPRDVDSELRQAVIDFHARYNEQKFNEIYDRSSRLFRGRISRDANAEFFSAKYARYGRVVSSEQVNKIEKSVSTGRIFVLTYTTKFQHDISSELIVFRDELSENGLLLAAYELD